jgi:hypothetical protein
MDKFAASAQREAARAIERDVAAAFPVSAAQVAVVPFSATRHIGIEVAEAMLAQWLPDSALEVEDQEFDRTKEEAPRPRGMARGPKYPRQD